MPVMFMRQHSFYFRLCTLAFANGCFTLFSLFPPSVLRDALSSSGGPARNCFYSCKVGVHYSCFHIWCWFILHPACSVKNLWFPHWWIQLCSASNHNRSPGRCHYCYLDLVREKGVERQVEVNEASVFWCGWNFGPYSASLPFPLFIVLYFVSRLTRPLFM